MNKIIQFWQELKRRNVVRRNTVYAATAFVILELVSIIQVPLKLPEWTLTFMIVLLSVGFIVSIVISWIYDISPEGGLEKTEPIHKVKNEEKPVATSTWKIASIVSFVLIIGLIVLNVMSRNNQSQIQDKLKKSIAVLPFENLTGDTTLNYFQRGISSYLSNDLGNSPQLSVRDEQSIFELTNDLGEATYAGFTASNEREMAQILKAETYLSGSYQGRNGNYLILVDLIDLRSGDKIWTDRIQGNLETSEYFEMADSLCKKIKDHLEIRVMKQEVDLDIREAYTNSSEAYRYYVEGMNSLLLKQEEHAVQSLSKALDIDPSFTLAKFYIAWAYADNGQIDSSALWIKRAWETKEKLPAFYQNWVELWHACFVSKNITDVRRSCQTLQQTETDSRFFWFDLGLTQLVYLEDYRNALNSFEKVEKISEERGGPWKYSQYYRYYTRALHKEGNHEKEEEINTMGQSLFTESPELKFNDAVCAASKGNWDRVAVRITEFQEIWDENSIEPKVREFRIARIFESAGNLDSALAHQRRSFALAPDDPKSSQALAKVLIQYDYDVKEGMDLLLSITDSTFLSNNNFYYYLLGWGYLKQGQAEEALPLLIKAGDMKPTAYRDFDERIKEAKQALSAQAKN